MIQDGLEEQIIKAVTLAPGEAILSYGRQSCKERLPYTSARDVGFHLTGPINWAGRTVQVEATANMVQEGHQATVDTVMEKKMKVRDPGYPQGLGRTTRPLTGTCNVDDWMRGLDKGPSNGEVKGPVMPVLNTQLDVVDDASDRENQGFLEVLPEAQPLQGVGVLIEEVIKALHT